MLLASCRSWLLLNQPFASPCEFRHVSLTVNMVDGRVLHEQAVRETDMPEKPTFHPIWPLPGAGSGQHASDSSREVCVQGQPVRERLAAAALAIPGGPLFLWDMHMVQVSNTSKHVRPLHAS